MAKLPAKVCALGALHKNKVSNSCAIPKELNWLFGQVNFVPDNLRGRKSDNGDFAKVQSHVH